MSATVPAPAYASKRNRRPRLVHIEPWEQHGRKPVVLCGAWMHREWRPRPGRPITCPVCLRKWQLGIRVYPPRYQDVPGKPGVCILIPDVPC